MYVLIKLTPTKISLPAQDNVKYKYVFLLKAQQNYIRTYALIFHN